MKKILIVALLLAGCSISLTPVEIRQSFEACEANKGLKELRADNFHVFVDCENGAYFSLKRSTK